MQVSKIMRTAMQRVSPLAMIKVKRGQQRELECRGVVIPIINMMKWCRITAIDLFDTQIKADGMGRLAAVIRKKGPC